jgi:GTP cyclohydrolase I
MNDPKNIEGMNHVRGLLQYIGEDVQREGLKDTPIRVLSAMQEHFSGYREDPKEHLLKMLEEV